MDVVEVLKAVREEVESTHWCQSHYETLTQLLGPEDTPLTELLPEWKSDPLYRLSRDVGVTGDVFAYKVQHCLVGMINYQTGVGVNRGSDENFEFDDQEQQDLWLGTINALGLTIFADEWDPRRRHATTITGAQGIEGWNDRSGRTREDILAAVDEAITLAS